MLKMLPLLAALVLAPPSQAQEEYYYGEWTHRSQVAEGARIMAEKANAFQQSIQQLSQWSEFARDVNRLRKEAHTFYRSVLRDQQNPVGVIAKRKRIITIWKKCFAGLR